MKSKIFEIIVFT